MRHARILAFGGMLAALHCARTQGIGQKVECSLLGGQIRLMGWTLTTAMWRDRNPGHRPGAHHRHAGAPGDERELQRQRRQAARLPAERRREVEGRR